MSPADIPVVDLAPFRCGDARDRADVAAELDAAYREVGFASVVGHGVPADLVERLMAVTAAFFALPAAEKARSVSATGHPNRGYQPMGNESLNRSYAGGPGADGGAPPDLFEAFTIGPVGRPDDDYHRSPSAGRYFEPNDWPVAPAGFAAVWTEYYVALEAVADLVMSVFATALGLPADHFVASTDRHITALRSLHYPPARSEPRPGQMRIGEHTDFGSITVLLADDTPGLQVATGEEPDTGWIDVAPVPGAFVVNVGDLLSEWSNRRWRSTRHRVAPVALDRSRTSWAFFHHPNHDAVIRTLPQCDTGAPPVLSEPVTAGAYLWRKLEALTV